MTALGTATVLRGDARTLPLPDASVDLIVTSPPYYSLRSYTDTCRICLDIHADGYDPAEVLVDYDAHVQLDHHYDEQIGSEPTPQAYIAALLDCTREWIRVLKPTGSIWVNLGDKYSSPGGHTDNGASTRLQGRPNLRKQGRAERSTATFGIPPKSLMLLPERYRIACVDDLELTARAVTIWSKPNGMPESVDDRVRRSHEDWVHLTKQPSYYAAVDEIRTPHTRPWKAGKNGGRNGWDRGDHLNAGLADAAPHPLGALPGSVWEIATEPLSIPDHIAHARCCKGVKRPGCEDGLDHYAAFPTEWPRRLILGWSPSGICTACGEGRRPVVDRDRTADRPGRVQGRKVDALLGGHGPDGRAGYRFTALRTITGQVCACTPYTDHPGAGTTRRRAHSPGPRTNNPQGTYGRHQAGEYQRVGPRREYHLDQWTPAPTRPAVVLDPFGGTGTTALMAMALGRHGITVDRSEDYCRLARWRTTDRDQLAKAMRVPKPPRQADGQLDLFNTA